MTDVEHKTVGSNIGGTFFLCSCGEAVDDWTAHVGLDRREE